MQAMGLGSQYYPHLMGLFARPQRCGFGYIVPAMRPSPRLEDEPKPGLIGGNHLFSSLLLQVTRPDWSLSQIL